MCATGPSHLSLFNFIFLIIFGKSTSYKAPMSFLIGPTILLNALFSHILSLCSSLDVRDPYKTKGKISSTYFKTAG
jgi:hypothetical protein